MDIGRIGLLRLFYWWYLGHSNVNGDIFFATQYSRSYFVPECTSIMHQKLSSGVHTETLIALMQICGMRSFEGSQLFTKHKRKRQR